LHKNPNNFKITFIFDTKIKMLTPLVHFSTITFKIARGSGSKIASFLVENDSGEHGPAMFVLFSNGA
jgi:hypothetical protein